MAANHDKGMSGVAGMTSRGRVMAALAGSAVDRTPVCNPTSVATVELMDLVDANFPDANRDGEKMARLAATSYTELGFDSVMPVFTIIQESSALGCEIQWEAKDNWPTVRMARPIWQTAEDVRMPSDFLLHPDITCVLDAIRRLRREFGDEVAIIGKTMGPWTLGYHVFGVEPFLLMSIDDPGHTKLCLERMKEITIAFGQAQIDAGADALTVPDHATGDLVSGEYYREFLRDLHTELVDEIPIPLILHICGRTVDRMDYIAETGLAAFHYDSKNDPAESMAIVTDRIALIGNINNPQTLFARGPEDVAGEVIRNLEAGVPLVGPECAIPLQTAIENLKEIPLAVQRWHADQARKGPVRADDQ
ncbi:MAG: methyltransferase [Planctomycetaceae bacterium]|jgi:[methyl-Co(III) methanol-specific corrinoid protein]:coenzyme M methyltransferase|nr:methyltransferase [Planctomycetaceae bacterium]MDP7276030.1 MtaA/CmuA family methyltransferase [Planctomycetaceae bacterium]